MQNFRNKLIAGGAVVIMAAIGTVMNRQAAQAQGSVVTIGAPIPLPVEAKQVGTWKVGLTGTSNVNVANAITAPLPVLDVSHSASQHVTLNCASTIGVCATQSGGLIPYVVPAGQNLVLTAVDFTALSSGGVFSLLLNPPSFFAGRWLVPADGFTHSFQYPGGIVLPAGFTFAVPNLTMLSIELAFVQGFLTSN